MAPGSDISPGALAVLGRAWVDHTSVDLTPVGIIDLQLFVEVDAALGRLGGAWMKHRPIYVFDVDPRPLVALLLSTGVLPRLQ